MTFINFKKYPDYVNPFIYTFDRILLESKTSERFQFRYEDALVDACHSNPCFKDHYFHLLLNNLNYSPSDLLYYNYLKSHTEKSKHSSVAKIRIKDILNDNWDEYQKYMSTKCSIPDYVYDAVDKVRVCKTKALGFDYYTCPNCNNFTFRFHTCKSRFCSSCGSKYVKQRSAQIQKKVFNCTHRHIVFTIPLELRSYFKKDKSLLDELFNSANDVINYSFNNKREQNRKDKTKQYKITPGFISVLHTFGRDLKWNPHIHMLISEGGHDSRTNKFINVNYFNYNLLRKSWQKCILDALHNKLGKTFYKIKNMLYAKKDNGFYVYAPNQQFTDTKKGIDYVVRYTGRPVMSESRIIDYDRNKVTWYYHPHEDESKKIIVTDTAFDFISKIIQHIPVKQFKTVRYYGAYAAKNHKYRDCKAKMYKDWEINKAKKLNEYRTSIIINFNHDPLECNKCRSMMELDYSKYVKRKDGKTIYEFEKKHKKKREPYSWQDRTGYCPQY